MNNCIKDLYDYELVKTFCRCGIVKLKSNFHKRSKSSDGLQSQCKSCVIQKQRSFDSENRERIISRNEDHRVKHHDKIMAQKKIYTKNR